MTCEEFREKLADFVGGELDAADHGAAREHVEVCESCRTLARGLQAAAEAFESAALPLDLAEQRVAALKLPAAPSSGMARANPRKPAWLAILRYAAVILLAFGAGYVTRDWRAAADPRADPMGTTRSGTVVSAAPGGEASLNPRLVRRLERAAAEFPRSSSLTWSLLSLAQQ